MPDNGSSSGLSTLQTVVALVITAASGWSAYQASTTNTEIARQGAALDQLKTQIAQSAEQRESVKLNHDITIRIFDEVKDIYKTPNQTSDLLLNRLLSVSALIEAVPDPNVRTLLGGAVKAAADNVAAALNHGADEGLKAKAQAVERSVDLAVYRAEQSDVRAASPPSKQAVQAVQQSNVENPKWANYDFDFFWCEGQHGDDAMQAAERAVGIKKLDPKASGRWRVRKLPAEVNSRPGYKVNGYRLHVGSDDEQKIAEVLKGILETSGAAPAGTVFDIKRVPTPTPWYISVFFCPDARQG